MTRAKLLAFSLLLCTAMPVFAQGTDPTPCEETIERVLLSELITYSEWSGGVTGTISGDKIAAGARIESCAPNKRVKLQVEGIAVWIDGFAVATRSAGTAAASLLPASPPAISTDAAERQTAQDQTRLVQTLDNRGAATPIPVAMPASIGLVASLQNQGERISGDVTQQLASGSSVYDLDIIRTRPESRMQIKFSDSTTLSLGPNCEIKLDSFVYAPGSRKGQLFLNIGQGITRFVTGSLESRSYKDITPLVTVGVRGTDFELLVEINRVVAKLHQGVIILTTPRSTSYTLDTPNQTFVIYRDGRTRMQRNFRGSIGDFAMRDLQPPRPNQNDNAPPDNANTRPNRASRDIKDDLGGGSERAKIEQPRIGGNSARAPFNRNESKSSLQLGGRNTVFGTGGVSQDRRLDRDFGRQIMRNPGSGGSMQDRIK